MNEGFAQMEISKGRVMAGGLLFNTPRATRRKRRLAGDLVELAGCDVEDEAS